VEEEEEEEEEIEIELVHTPVKIVCKKKNSNLNALNFKCPIVTSLHSAVHCVSRWVLNKCLTWIFKLSIDIKT